MLVVAVAVVVPPRHGWHGRIRAGGAGRLRMHSRSPDSAC
jgi:hypothetical protein